MRNVNQSSAARKLQDNNSPKPRHIKFIVEDALWNVRGPTEDGLGQAERTLAYVLASRLNPQGFCNPGGNRLALNTGMNLRTIREATKSLKARGVLNVKVGSKGASNVYSFNLDALLALRSPRADQVDEEERGSEATEGCARITETGIQDHRRGDPGSPKQIRDQVSEQKEDQSQTRTRGSSSFFSSQNPAADPAVVREPAPLPTSTPAGLTRPVLKPRPAEDDSPAAVAERAAHDRELAERRRQADEARRQADLARQADEPRRLAAEAAERERRKASTKALFDAAATELAAGDSPLSDVEQLFERARRDDGLSSHPAEELSPLERLEAEAAQAEAEREAAPPAAPVRRFPWDPPVTPPPAPRRPNHTTDTMTAAPAWRQQDPTAPFAGAYVEPPPPPDPAEALACVRAAARILGIPPREAGQVLPLATSSGGVLPIEAEERRQSVGEG
jgi:hypothetical protein